MGCSECKGETPYWSADSSKCVAPSDCPAGEVPNEDEKTCDKCPKDKPYQSGPKCVTQCPAGHAPDRQTKACTACPAETPYANHTAHKCVKKCGKGAMPNARNSCESCAGATPYIDQKGKKCAKACPAGQMVDEG